MVIFLSAFVKVHIYKSNNQLVQQAMSLRYFLFITLIYTNVYSQNKGFFKINGKGTLTVNKEHTLGLILRSSGKKYPTIKFNLCFAFIRYTILDYIRQGNLPKSYQLCFRNDELPIFRESFRSYRSKPLVLLSLRCSRAPFHHLRPHRKRKHRAYRGLTWH